MYSNLVTTSWIGTGDGYELRYRVYDSDSVDFTFKGSSQAFEITYDAEALRRFLEFAGRALAEMDALRADEEADAPD